jgi:hypothetical protein
MAFGLLCLFLAASPEIAGSAQLDQSYYPPASALRVHGRTGAFLADGAAEQSQSPWASLVNFLSHATLTRGVAEPKVELADDVHGHAKLTVQIALFLVVVPAMIAIGLTYLMPPFLAKDSVLRKHYGYLFFAHRNAEFGANYELAVRATVGVVILASPFLLPAYSDLIKTGYYTSTAVMLFCFTLYKTVGETVNFAFEGILGTLFAVLNIWVMNGIFPEGYQHDSADSVFYVAVADCILYILFIVGADLDAGCKMFALNWHCYFIMDFLNPNVSGVYSSNWRIDIKGPAVSGLVQSCIGVGVAVLVTLLPFPLFALDKARDCALNLSDSLTDAWDAGITCFVNANKDQLAETKFRHDISSLKSSVSSMGGYAAISWWECMGLPGKPQKVRDFLGELSGTVTESFQRLQGIRHLCRVVKRGPEHLEIMSHMKPHLEELCKQSGELMKFMTAGAVDGSFDESEKATIADLKKKVEASITTVTQEYTKKQAEMKVDLFHQAAFCLAYCSYARIALDFEKVLQKNLEHGMFFDNIFAWFKQFKIPLLTDSTVRNCWMRSCASILLCFLVGYRGYSAILPGYNAVPAATVSLLLSSGLTAQATKNLARFEGVVLGIVFGQIAYALLGWCSISGYIGVALFLVFWCLSTFIMYYHTVDFSLLGCLLAAFGVVGVLRGCSNDVFEAGGSYNTVVGVVVAITIKVAVDSMLARSRASEEATSTLVSAWEQLETAFKEFFDPNVSSINFKNGAIKATFSSASTLSVDADKEPRLWWCLWKHSLFTEACSNGEKICESLSNLEAAFSKSGRDGGAKSSTLAAIQGSESFEKVKEALLGRIAAMKALSCEAFSYNKDGFFASEYEIPKGLADFGDLMADISKLASNLRNASSSEMSRTSAGGDEDVFENLEYDMHCKISVFYFTTEWISELIEELDTSLLSQ